VTPAARTLSVVDYHTEGEPMRIVVGGVERIPGATLMERSEHLAPMSSSTSRRGAPTRSSATRWWWRPAGLDRSPCGTGTSGRLANLHARGRLGVGEPFGHE
jgi:proline racemase